MPIPDVTKTVRGLPLVDHHVHSVLQHDPSGPEFELLLTESSLPAPAGTSHLDSQAGFALRRHCAPLLDLPAHAPIDVYLARRTELGHEEVARRLLRAAGVSASLIDTGVLGDASPLAPNEVFSEIAAHGVSEIVRLETLAESLLTTGVRDEEFPHAFRTAVASAAQQAVGFKSIVAYRYGFDFDPAPVEDREVVEALSRLESAGRRRIGEPTLLRFLLQVGADSGLPLQLHAGYGDADLDLTRCDPALLMPWLRRQPETGSAIMLLHCYPYHREAGYLAQVFPRVYFDLGLGINYSGAASTAIIRAGLELAPFGKQLYSSDAWGLPELHLLGAVLWRDGLARALQEFVERGEWDASEAIRVAELICSGNAKRVYGLA